MNLSGEKSEIEPIIERILDFLKMVCSTFQRVTKVVEMF